ncbi:MAG: phosphate ABC transporter ATP-binding protein PstB [Candidatus Cloacimonetes bacterium]|nr:phosphate ABC transporter ATP-binding protein PstB [Candidatus Cloacimonadota bacterium]
MESSVLKVENFFANYGEGDIVKDINVEFERNKVHAIMGPSGCGKTTFMRCINRMHELTPNSTVKGKIMLNNEDIYKMNPIDLRRKIGMVFQKANPFPTMSIYDNVISGYLLNGIKLSKNEKDQIVEESLKNAALWEEAKDILHRKGTFLSGGQQQRLCIARGLAMKPDILLLDEPTSALDPRATSKIEKLMVELRERVTIILVTHNIGQAARVSNYTAFIYLGELIEYGATDKLFTVPKDKRTEEYLTGKFG